MKDFQLLFGIVLFVIGSVIGVYFGKRQAELDEK